MARGHGGPDRAALATGSPSQTSSVRRVDYVGPQVGKQLRNKGIMALLYAMLAILVYVAFRFDFKFGPGALVAMVHDVIMVSGYYLVSRREFNLTSIAVLLTIIGYSINDTIVIYDRIREEMARYKGKPLPGDHQHRGQRHAGAHHPHLRRHRALADRPAHLRGRGDLGLRGGDAGRHRRRHLLVGVHREPADHLARERAAKKKAAGGAMKVRPA